MAASPVDGVPRPARVSPVPLGRLAQGRGTLHGHDRAVSGITASSDRARPGDLFAALPGRVAHGASYAAAAVAAGAGAVLTDEAGRAALPADLQRAVPVFVVPDVRAVLGPVSADVYDHPARALTLLGVTGTSGKTTTTFLIRAGLRAAGRTTGVIGTVATMIGDDEVQAGFTTPEAPDLQALLAVMRERGVTDVAMEVSSHALAMHRVDGTGFRAAGFTNLSEDHLDFHTDMTEYFAVKAMLFEPRFTDRAVVCVDDVWGRRLIQVVGPGVSVSTDADRAPGAWQAHHIVDAPGGGTRFGVRGPVAARGAGEHAEFSMACAIPGRYNVANAVLALALLHEAGVDPRDVIDAVSVATVPGRMEPVDAGQPFLAVVDYSHKPAAVEGALAALRPLTPGRLIIALGCGGDRDSGKRPHMGAIACRDADLLVVTDDNPRSENPAAIRAAMLEGVEQVPPAARAEVVEIGDRAAAITAAVERARPGDTVLIAGKGHETGQEIAGVVHPFDDRDVLRRALLAVGGNR